MWGLFPVLTLLVFEQVSPLVTYAWSSLFALLTFAIILTIRRSWKEILDWVAFKDVLKSTFFIGVVFYGFLFWGLAHTNAGNASLLLLAEVFFTFLLFNVFRKEYIPREHIWGAVLMVLGAGIVLYPNFSDFQLGDVLILIGTIFAPFGNFYSQRARKRISSEAMMFQRSGLIVVLGFVAAAIFNLPASPAFVEESLVFLMINGAVMFGLSKIFWIEGIHRISVTKAISLASTAPIFTLLFAWWILGDVPTIWQLTAFIPLFAGVLLLSYKGNFKEMPAEVP